MKRSKCPECGFVGWADAECCKKCGAPVVVDSENLVEQLAPAYANKYQEPDYGHNYQYQYAGYQPEVSQGWAITSLVSGILNFLFLGIFVVTTIAGIVISIVALRKINRSPLQYGGKSLAIGGLVMNIISLVAIIPILLIAMVAIPNLLAARRAANEGSAIASMQKLHNAEAAYQSMYEKFGTMAELEQENLITAELAGGTRHGYRFKIETVSDRGDDSPGFTAVGVPTEYGSTGRRSFYVDESGEIRGADSQGQEATRNDPLLKFDYDPSQRSASRGKQPPVGEY
jgi:type IV pilus assembly protein PilA